MLIFLFLLLLCCQSKAAVAIIHMYMYNNLLILKLPWLSRHARAACANQIKAANYGTNWCTCIYIYKKKKKKNCLLKNIYVSSNIGSFGDKLEHALRSRFTTHPTDAEKCI